MLSTVLMIHKYCLIVDCLWLIAGDDDADYDDDKDENNDDDDGDNSDCNVHIIIMMIMLIIWKCRWMTMLL